MSHSLSARIHFARQALSVFCQMRPIKDGCFGVISLLEIPHVMPLVKSFELCIASFQHVEDLYMGPVIHVQGTYCGNSHAVRAMTSTTLKTKQTAVAHRRPCGMGCATIHTVTISREAAHSIHAGAREARCHKRRRRRIIVSAFRVILFVRKRSHHFQLGSCFLPQRDFSCCVRHGR